MEHRKTSDREDPRVLRTRHLLLQAFSNSFSEKGFHAMTVQDITERAGVNRGTFYSHFEDKYAILEWWLREQFQQRVASTVLISTPWTTDTFRTLIESTVQWFTQLHPLTRSADRSLVPLVVTTLQEALFELLLQGFKTVAGPAQHSWANLETVALVTSWAIFGTGFQCFRQWDEPTMHLPPEELADQATHILLDGLAHSLPAFSLA